MIPGAALKFVLFAAALILVVVLVRRAFMRPNRATGGPGRPDRLRMPKLVVIIAWALLGVGLLMSLLAFGSGSMRDPVPFRIASVILVALGLLVLLVYGNWYLAPGKDEIVFRTFFGAVRVIRYDDIAGYRMIGRGGRRMLFVKASSGTRLTVDLTRHDVPELLAHVEFHQANGRWPAAGELR
ncbi:hypothetical protein [Microbacterium sp. SD291]|uniref:hypothetical protein n=1 Tax=Microbacterium sp. SD291 TaxID=2782007 RepID=UPI001A968F79|nr:hypothetical protein [Microbacterium sp. SD291]MBO0981193.1 hypothetical protein [Microbacterium sp. SD291]